MPRFIEPQKERKVKEPKPITKPRPGTYTSEDLEKARSTPSPNGA